MKPKVFTFLVLLFGSALIVSAQVTLEQLKLNKDGKYHYIKTVAVSGATEATLIAKTKEFLTEYVEQPENPGTWEQPNDKNLFVVSVEMINPVHLILTLEISLIKGAYKLDVHDIRYYTFGWKTAETALGNEKAEFAEFRKKILLGLNTMVSDIKKGIK